jgi:integrase
MERKMSDDRTHNPFTSADQPALQAVLDAIESDMALPQQRRRNLCSSIRSLGKLMGQDLRYLPAHPRYYRDLLKRLHPETCGLSLKRIGNIKSDVLFALRHTGCIGRSHTYMAPFTPEWQELWDQADGADRRRHVSRFMHFCSANGISPDAVDDQVSETFRQSLINESFVKDPVKNHQNSIRTWNQIVDLVPDWPAIKLTVPRYKETYSIPLDAFPKPFRDEVEALFRRWAGKDILDDVGTLKPMKIKTIESRRYRLRQIASALVLQGSKIEDVTSLSQVVQIDAAKQALRFYLDRAGGKTTSQIHSLAVLIKMIAKHWVGVDEDHLNGLKDLCRKLDPGNKGLTEKNRERLRQFDDSRNVGLLLNFPRKQVEGVRCHDKGLRQDAVTVQIALAVEILLMSPMRAENLVNLNMQRHIQRSRAGQKGVVHLVIPAEEVKNGEHLEFTLQPETVELLDLYIRDYHPRLVTSPSPWLFPGAGGKPKTRELFGDQVSKHVFKATGLHVNLHLFRHIAAKLYLDQNPGGYEVCRRILGHRSMDTTTRFYAGMETAAAGRHFDEEILKLRRSLGGTTAGAP